MTARAPGNSPASWLASAAWRPFRPLRWALGCVALLLAVTGCGSDTGQGKVTQDSLGKFEQGRKELAAKDVAAARDSFASAAEAGGLQVDLYCEARLQQAYCHACLGDHAAAHALLDELAGGAPDLGRVHAMRSFVFLRQGTPDKAEAELQKARALTPGIAVPAAP